MSGLWNSYTQAFRPAYRAPYGFLTGTLFPEPGSNLKVRAAKVYATKPSAPLATRKSATPQIGVIGRVGLVPVAIPRASLNPLLTGASSPWFSV